MVMGTTAPRAGTGTVSFVSTLYQRLALGHPRDLGEQFFKEHQGILDRLLMPYEQDGDEYYCEFTPKTASAFLLTHVFLHELGHHYDRMQTKAKEHCPGGED